MSAIWVPSKLSELTGNIVAVSPTSSTKTVVVRGAPSQTANLQEWQNSSGTALSWIQANGVAYFPYAAIGGGPFGSTQFSVSSQSATNKALVVVAAASQSANLQEWQNSSGTALSWVAASGRVTGRDFGLATSSNAYYDSSLNYWSHYAGSPGVYPCNLLGGGAAGTVKVVVKGTASQSASLQEWQDSSGNVLGSFSPTRFAVATSGGSTLFEVDTNSAKYGFGISGYTTNTLRIGVGVTALYTDNSGLVSIGGAVYTPSAQLDVRASSSSTKALVVRGAASQSANLQEWQNSSGTNLSKLDAAGNLIVRGDRGISSALVGGTNTPQIFVQNYSASDIAAVVKGAASQSANLQEWQDSSGNVTVSVRGAAGAHGHIVMSSPAGQGAGSGIDFYSNDRAYFGLIQLDGSGNVVLRNNNSGGGTYVDFTNGAYFRSAAGTPLKLNASGSGAAAVVTPAAATDKGLVVQGAPSQSANLQEWQDSNGTAMNRIAANGKTYWGTAELNAAHNFYTAYYPRVAAFQCNAAAGGEAIVSVATGNLVVGDYYVVNAGGWSTGNAYMHIHNSGSGDAILEAVAYGSGGAYVRTGVNGGQNWAAGLDRSVNGYKISAYGVPGIEDVVAITPTGGTSLFSLASGTVPLSVYANTGSQTANLQEWKNSSGSTRAAVNSIGYFGIGTGNPMSTLHMYGSCTFWMGQETGYGNVYSQQTIDTAANTLTVQVTKEGINYGDILLSPAGGFVGVGTSTPGAKLDVFDSSTTNLQMRIRNNKTDSTSNTAELVLAARSGGQLFDRAKILSRSSNTGNYRTEMDFQTINKATGVFESRMSFDSDGNVGVNNTSPGALLHAVCPTASTKGLIVQGAASQTADLQQYQDSSGTVLAGVTYNGIVYSGVASGDFGVGIECGQANAAIQARGSGNPQLRANSTSGAISKMQAIGNSFGLVGTETNHPFKLYTNQNACVYFDTTGYVGVGNFAATGQLEVRASAASTKAFIARAATSQTANLTEWQDSSGTALSSVDKSGYICVPTGSGAPGTNPTSGGGLYYDTANGKLYAWDGSAWKSVALS